MTELSKKTKGLNRLRKIFMFPFMERILLLLTVNKPPGSFFIKLIPNNYQYPPHTYRFIKREGIHYKVDLYDYIGWWIYFGIKEKGRTRLLKLIRKNDIIIDVGANIGETVLNFARSTFPDGEVHGFEPDRLNFQRCTENIKLNTFTNIQLNNVGLGSRNGHSFIKTLTPSNRGQNKVSDAYIEDATSVIEIITLDQYVEKKQLQRVNLIKIDVEGYELNVLKGATHTLKKFKPVLFIELDDNNLKEQKHSAKELIEFLVVNGYCVTNSETEEKINASYDFSNCHFDIICLPDK